MINNNILQDFEVDLSKIPDKGSALLVLYHGSTGVDMGFLFCSIYLEKQRKINVICDKLLFKLPGNLINYNYRLNLILMFLIIIWRKYNHIRLKTLLII